jgi:hypothetical protein
MEPHHLSQVRLLLVLAVVEVAHIADLLEQVVLVVAQTALLIQQQLLQLGQLQTPAVAVVVHLDLITAHTPVATAALA